MTKYINADKLIHDLEERIYAYSEGYANGDDCRKDAIETLLKDVKYQLSLQQEQPDFPTTDEEIEILLATHPKVEVPNKYKTPDWLWKKQEQPEADLEKEIDRVSKRYPEVSFAKLSRIAVHFAKWKEAQDQETIELAEEHAYLAGAVNEREKMMKEAVEAHIYQSANPVSEIGHQLHQAALLYEDKENAPYLKAGDKVRIIIVKDN